MNPAAVHRFVPYAADLPSPALARAWDRLAGLAAPVWYWQGRDGADEVWLGVGAAERFPSLGAARAALALAEAESQLPLRAFAALPFDLTQAGGAIILPELLIHGQGGQAALMASSSAGQLAAQVVELIRREEPPVRMPTMVDGGRVFSRDDWTLAIEAIRAEIEAGRLHKAVLARDTIRRAQRAIPVSSLLERLGESLMDSYLIAFGTAGRSFVSATPERLLALCDDELVTESLAGTRPRGRTGAEDRQWADELRHSEKDRREQQIVTDFIAAELEGLCEVVERTREPDVRKLATVQHLSTRITARLRPGLPLDRLLSALHPTPAVCGLPREAARSRIADLEPVPRGFYAGALGWLSSTAAEFAVGIRSAVVENSSATIYAGAGIMAASTASAEWQETAWKMAPLLRALGCEG